ncbi:MAG: hypothetical protein H0U76_03875 [Ktedonobacteraceae bacterium]|nr:hypothetical protein [Ktedonobacteraceae bacterium]
MTLAPDKQGFRYTKYRWEEVFSLLISREKDTGISVIHAASEQGRRITIECDLPWRDTTLTGRRVAVLLGRSSDWYKYRLNVYAVQVQGIEWIICGTHDTCVNVPVWSVEEGKLYDVHETRIAFADLLGQYQRYWFTEFGHKLLLGGMYCNIPAAKEVALKLQKSARFALEAEVRRHAHRRKGPPLKIGRNSLAYLTLDDIRAEAERRGYVLKVSGTAISAAKKQFAHVNCSFTRKPDFSLSPRRAEEYALLQIYYWIRGYHLNYGDDGKVELHRGMHHPQYDQQARVAETWNYFDFPGLADLHQEMCQWVERVE